ncbi:TIR-like protein FxsC [Streptomyces europaeiscabiei]|uniref:TIR-like protein FxsC n=1 Tax=Streptomyces europaeiscabiei TaxID=146819 RepID=UPI0029B78997|nr:TIR-like protein FxsC [Streptomyces europaeiscabiei]MDX3691370.1 TIR-like protein FxsC [Streptomyces europaeiscabiei]
MVQAASQATRSTVSSDPYVFFMSYARTPVKGARVKKDPSDVALEEFHNLLCSNIMQLTDHDGEEAPGFLDQGMDTGADWESRIKHALATCRVFVPIYNTRYFTREWCGREWDAFARRQEEQLRTRPYTGNAIVPVLWVGEQHLTLPPVAAKAHYAHPKLGKEYLQAGLYGFKQAGRSGKYRNSVWELAQMIVKVAQQTSLESCDLELFKDLRNVFEGE